MNPIKCTLIFLRESSVSHFMSEFLRDNRVKRQSISKREY